MYMAFLFKWCPLNNLQVPSQINYSIYIMLPFSPLKTNFLFLKTNMLINTT